MLLIFLFLILITARNSFSLNHGRFIERNSNCTSLTCKFLDDIFIKDLNKDANPCEDPYSFVCTNDSYSYGSRDNTDLHLILLFTSKNLSSSIFHYLNDSNVPEINELKSLKVERDLFQQCMRFGVDKNETKKIYKRVDEMIENLRLIASNNSWQVMYEEIHKLGAGNIFFDIKVSRSPIDPTKNIITLQPPKFFSMFWKLLPLISVSKSPDVQLEIDNLPVNETQEFFKSFFPIYVGINSINETSEEFINIITTINKWHDIYNFNSSVGATGKLNWKRIFQKTFKKANITVRNTELVFIKNKSYFIKLAHLLSASKDSVITKAILMMLKIRYSIHNYFPNSSTINLSNLRHEEDLLNKFSLCVHDMPLYGVSYILLRSWEAHENFTSKRQHILRNVVEVMKSDIMESEKMSDTEKLYYTKRIDDFTTSLSKSYWNTSFISNFYENYSTSKNYLDNYMNYQKFIKNKELSILRESPDLLVSSVPFSLHHFGNVRDQLIKIMYYNRIQKDEFASHYFLQFPKEFHYGAYGSKIAKVLYTALNEDKIDAGIAYHLIQNYPFTFTTHPYNSLACLKFEQKENEIKSIENLYTLIFIAFAHEAFRDIYFVDNIAEQFGVSVSYKAMQYDRTHNFTDLNHDKMILTELSLTSEQLFFVTFIKSRCDKIQPLKIRNLNINYLDGFYKAFHCDGITSYKSSNDKNVCNPSLYSINSTEFVSDTKKIEKFS